MAISCTKQFTLKVTGGGPFAYYKMDSSASGMQDSVGPYSIPSFFLGSPDLQPGIINDGYQSDAGTSLVIHGSDYPDLTGKDYTVRFWFKLTTAWSVERNIYIVSAWQWVEIDGDGTNGTIVMYNAPADTGNTVDITGTLNSIHRAVCRYSFSQNKSWIRIDNGTDTEYQHLVPPASNTPSVPFSINMAAHGGTTFLIDELGLWDRMLSDAEVDDDWNSGAGKTYP